MPYYWGLHVPKQLPEAVPAVAVSHRLIVTGSQPLANWSISFGVSSLTSNLDVPIWSLYNSDLSTTAGLLSQFVWVVYGFNSGHFVHMIRDRELPFQIFLAAYPFANGCTLLQELTMCPTILSGAPALLDHIRGSGLTSKLTGYLIHSHPYQVSKPTHKFWDLQAHIVTQFGLI